MINHLSPSGRASRNGPSKRVLPAQNVGFTLPELLVSVTIAVVVAIVIAPVLIGQLLQEKRLEAAQRLRENFSRLNYLMQIEASEAEEIVVGASPPGCGNQGFTLWIPRPADVYGPSQNRSGVQYFVSNGEIWRCGPRVFRNGTLNHPPLLSTQGVVSGPVVRNATFSLVNPPAAGVPVKQLTYQVDFTGGNFGIAGNAQPVTLFARSVFVCNPDNPETIGADVGDCPP